MYWSAYLDPHPIKLPDGRALETLACCRAFMLELPERDQLKPPWQAAAAALLHGAEHGGPFLFIARVAVARALNGTAVGRPPTPIERPDQGDAWKAKRAQRKRQ